MIKIGVKDIVANAIIEVGSREVLLAFVDDKVVDKSFNLYKPKQKVKGKW